LRGFGRVGGIIANSGEKSAAAARCWWSRGRRKGEQQKGRSSVRFYRDAKLGGSEGEGEQSRGQAQIGGRLRRARRGGVAAARDRLPDMERRGEDSGGCTGGGRSGRVTRGRGERCRTAQQWPARQRRRGVLHRRQGAHGQAAGDVAEQGEVSAGREAAGQRPERHVHGRRGVRERQRRRTWPGSGGGVRQRRNRGGTEGGRRRGPKCNFREMQGPYGNASITFKPVLK
jgi:hypothetical protein